VPESIVEEECGPHDYVWPRHRRARLEVNLIFPPKERPDDKTDINSRCNRLDLHREMQQSAEPPCVSRDPEAGRGTCSFSVGSYATASQRGRSKLFASGLGES